MGATLVAGLVSSVGEQAVETKIAQGATTISTPSESRAKLAKELASKHGAFKPGREN